LAIPALRDLLFYPGPLYGMILGEALYGGNALALGIIDGNLA